MDFNQKIFKFYLDKELNLSKIIYLYKLKIEIIQ